MKNTQDKYIPGVCNIGPEEIKRRKRSGYIGILLSIGFIAASILFDMAPAFKLLIFIPVFMASIGFLQARMRFCANFGLRGIYNLTKSAGQTENVAEKEARAMDRNKALKIIGYSAVIAFVVALVFYNLAI